MGDLGRLLGGCGSLKKAAPMLTSFWNKYRVLFPRHHLWKDVDEQKKSLSRCIPVYLHGDEGTYYRKSGVLVCSFQGAIGSGCSKQKKDTDGKPIGEGIPLNYLQTALQTRILTLVCPKEGFIGKNCNYIYIVSSIYRVFQVPAPQDFSYRDIAYISTQFQRDIYVYTPLQL